MSDGLFLILAAGALTVIVVVALKSKPEGRNPHVNARKWNTRRPS